MKIEKHGIRITDLPGGWVIETLGDGTVGFGSSVYSMEEIREIRDALNAALAVLRGAALGPHRGRAGERRRRA